ncbi:hypothetical protein EYF80_046499 [Liparis tanakae]|uniref:Uncharacterized protein n=1 Tax=Liparis tanakae TaxID=230148 RepID=A0A4Z2FRA6_9TELE|nr:hypothetical protein EYF80_046499 [Liparis tanakae]
MPEDARHEMEGSGWEGEHCRVDEDLSGGQIVFLMQVAQLGADGCDVNLQLGFLLGHPLTQRAALLHLRRLLLHPQLQLTHRLLLDHKHTQTSLRQAA